MDMTPERWRLTNEYLREVFGREDEAMAQLAREAAAAGLPDISISADVGRLLMILTSMTRGRLALEIGTLGGYSAVWIARGLQPGGRLITIESDTRHATFAQRQFERLGLSGQVEVRNVPALDELPRLAEELGPGTIDLVFLDAVKEEYPDYWAIVRPMIAPGGLILADNACGSSGWWIDDLRAPSRRGADAFNRLVARDPDFEAAAVPLRQGVLIGKRVR